MFRFGTGALDLPSPFPHEQDTLLVHVSSVIRPTESVDRTRKAQASNEQALNLSPNLVFRTTTRTNNTYNPLLFREIAKHSCPPIKKESRNHHPLLRFVPPRSFFAHQGIIHYIVKLIQN